jgi:hypothetical protein
MDVCRRVDDGVDVALDGRPERFHVRDISIPNRDGKALQGLGAIGVASQCDDVIPSLARCANHIVSQQAGRSRDDDPHVPSILRGFFEKSS